MELPEPLQKASGQYEMTKGPASVEGTVYWGNMSISDPVDDIQMARRAFVEKWQCLPEALVMDGHTFFLLEGHPQFRDLRHGRPGGLHFTDLLYEEVGVKRIEVDCDWNGKPYCAWLIV